MTGEARVRRTAESEDAMVLVRLLDSSNLTI
jgi:hypothetical protein